ncbi:MAG: hypothetical protein ACKOEZ_07105 [Spartobacteria bacterium]
MSAAPQSLVAESAVYRSAAPQTLRLRLADIEDLLPRERLLRPIAKDETVEVPAGHILAHIVPTLSLRLLAELRPDLIEPSHGVLRLPAHRIAKGYGLLETKDSTPPEPDDFLFRDEIPSASAHLGKILAQPEEPQTEIEEPAVEPLEAAAEAESEPPPRRLAEIISNLPTFQRVTETTFLTLKPLAPEPPQASAAAEPVIPDQHALQALFMTDENLNTGRVVELCGGLPGIQSCVLTSGNHVVASHNTPEGLDIVSLSSNAAAMLQAMHDASAGMGIGEIPAVTLHTARGPLSIFQKEHLAMLVFHGDRGFVPGVREKMTAALGELTRAPLALPSSTTEG